MGSEAVKVLFIINMMGWFILFFFFFSLFSVRCCNFLELKDVANLILIEVFSKLLFNYINTCRYRVLDHIEAKPYHNETRSLTCTAPPIWMLITLCKFWIEPAKLEIGWAARTITLAYVIERKTRFQIPTPNIMWFFFCQNNRVIKKH